MGRAKKLYPSKVPSTWVLYDLCVSGTCGGMLRKRAAWAWQGKTDVEWLTRDHAVLMVYAGGARRLTQ